MAGAAAPAQLGVRLINITELPQRITALSGGARARAERLLDVNVATGHTVPPPELDAWLEHSFGSVDAVREQRVVKVTNRATLEATLFAPLRLKRPVDGSSDGELGAEVAQTHDDPLCNPETGTPADTFGRVRGARIVTGANAALADAHHAVLVFDTHDPLAFDPELITDVLATGREWAERARAGDPGAGNYLLIWNCLWRAGGSIVHGHAQALLGSGLHYAAVERLRRARDRYAERASAELVDDLVALHRDLGLARALAGGVTLLAHVTPIKERELLLVGTPGMDERDPAFTDAVARTLVAYRDRIGVRSFNLALWRAPLDAPPEWRWLPPIVRLVDRGDPFRRSSDIGAMELYATPVVGSDPFELIDSIGSIG